MTLRNKAAIVGIGATEFSKNSGRSELQLAVEAITEALADAGLSVRDVDGLASVSMDANLETQIFRNLGGRELTFFGRVASGGGSAGAVVLQAAMAVATGVADTVVCYRAMNERSSQRFGRATTSGPSDTEPLLWSLHAAQGLQTPAACVAIAMRRYMHETGATSADFGRVAVTLRRYAATNPKAWYFGKPITLDEHQTSPMIADPIRLLDCCQESDGAVALVVTSTARARDLRQTPALIRAAAQGLTGQTYVLTSFYRDDITPREESALVARQLYEGAGLGPQDMQAAMIYDHFAPTLLPALEAYGFCAFGEAKDFVKDGHMDIDGRLPVNTHGGQLGEAYIHGMNGFTEAVRQLRGTAVNQIAKVEHVLVASANGLPTSGVILGAA